MKKFIVWLLVGILTVGMMISTAFAAPIEDALDYSVSVTRIDVDSSGAGSFTISVPKPDGSDGYTTYAGVNYKILPPSGAEIVSVSYNLTGGGSSAPSLQGESDGIINFNNASQTNIYSDDMKCTVNLRYYGASDATLTILKVTQQYRRDSSGYYDYKISDKQVSISLGANPAVVNSNATLSRLSINTGELRPGFSPNTTSYTVAHEGVYGVPHEVNSITIDAVADAASLGATVSGAGTKTLSVGTNSFEIKVTAPDGTTTRTYTLTTFRADTDQLRPDQPDPGKDDPEKEDPEKQDPEKQDPEKQDPEKQDPEKQDPTDPIDNGGNNNGDGTQPGGGGGGGTTGGAPTGSTPTDDTPTVDIEDPDVALGDSTVTEKDVTSTPGVSYTDVSDPNEWYYKAVYYVTEKGLMRGTGDGLFSPEAPVTRAMFVTILGRMAESLGETTTGFGNPFEDVPAGEWYTQYVAWGADKGIVLGYSETEFGPDDPVNREQMAALMIRFCEYREIDLDDSRNISFSDVESISGWAKESVEKAVAAGLMQGSNGQFNPLGTATRAEIAQVFMNLSEAYLN